MTGFEPATPCTPCKYSTRLSYTPTTPRILYHGYRNYKYFFISPHIGKRHVLRMAEPVFNIRMSGHNLTKTKQRMKQCQNVKTNMENVRTVATRPPTNATRKTVTKKIVINKIICRHFCRHIKTISFPPQPLRRNNHLDR